MRYFFYSALFFLTGCSALKSMVAPDPATGVSDIDAAIGAGLEQAVNSAAGGMSTQDAVIGGAITSATILTGVLLRKFLKNRKASG